MHRAQEQVRDFHRAIGARRPPRLDPDWNDIYDLRLKLIREEVDELIEAADHFDVPGCAQEMSDILYVVYGMAVAMGIDLEKAFEEVHRANMEKVGGPKRADGKQLKPYDWDPPHIKEDWCT